MIRRAGHRTTTSGGATQTAKGRKSNKSFVLGKDSPTKSAPEGQLQPSEAGRAVRRTVAELDQQRKSIDALIADAANGRDFKPAELLALQAKVYRYGQQL